MIPEQESAYAATVKASGKEGLLRQLFVHRAGHCAFTAAETIVAAQVIVDRLEHGTWNDVSLRPESLNKRAAALGSNYARGFDTTDASRFFCLVTTAFSAPIRLPHAAPRFLTKRIAAGSLD